MAEDFYNTWLGVAPGVRPPDHYRLLGLALWCNDPAKIEQAARAQLAKLDRYAINQDPAKRAACNRLMNEVAKARVVLASPPRRAGYDRELARRLDVAMPGAEVMAAEVVFDDDAEQKADDDAEAYLNAIASAAGAAGKRRKRPAKRNAPAMPIAAGIVGVALIAVLIIWLLWKPSRQQAQTSPPPTAGPVDEPTVAPVVVSRPNPSLRAAPPVVGKLFGLPVGQPPADDTTPVGPPPVASPSIPAPSPSVAPANQPATVENPPKPATPASDSGPVAWTAQMNSLDNWTVVHGDWQTTSDGRILGKGDSQINFNQSLPENVALSFRLRVLSGMRPRIKFGDTKLYIGNEGYNKVLMVHGNIQDATGQPVAYELNQEMAIRVVFLPDDRYSIRINGQTLTGRHSHVKDGKIAVQVLAGDWWSKGSTEFWDFKVGAVSVVDPASGKVSSAGETDFTGPQSAIASASAVAHGDFITDWRVIGPFRTQ